MPGKINTLAREITDFIERNEITLPDGFLPRFLENLISTLNSLKSAAEFRDSNTAFTAFVVVDSLEAYLQTARIKQYLNEEGAAKIGTRISECIDQTFIQIATDRVSVTYIPIIKEYAEKNATVWATKFIEYIDKQDSINLATAFAKLTDMITLSILNKVRINSDHDIYTEFAKALNININNLAPYIEVETDVTAITAMIKSCIPTTSHASDTDHRSTNPVTILSNIEARASQHVNQQFNAVVVAESLQAYIPSFIQHQNNIKARIAASSMSDSYPIIADNYRALIEVKKQIAHIANTLSQRWLGTLLQSFGLAWTFEAVKSHRSGEILKEMSAKMQERMLEQVLPYYTLPEKMFELGASAPKPKAPII